MTGKTKSQLYDSFSDEELVDVIRHGNSDALSVLAVRYNSVARGIASSYHSDAFTYDDWFQECMIALIFAARSFRSDSASFRTYASVCIKNRLNTVLKSQFNSKNALLNSYLQYDDTSVPAVHSPEDSYIENERYRFFTDSFLSQLSETEKKVIGFYLAGFSYQEIADKLRMTQKSVDNALCRAKAKLKKSSDII